MAGGSSPCEQCKYCRPCPPPGSRASQERLVEDGALGRTLHESCRISYGTAREQQSAVQFASNGMAKRATSRRQRTSEAEEAKPRGAAPHSSPRRRARSQSAQQGLPLHLHILQSPWSPAPPRSAPPFLQFGLKPLARRWPGERSLSTSLRAAWPPRCEPEIEDNVSRYSRSCSVGKLTLSCSRVSRQNLARGSSAPILEHF